MQLSSKLLREIANFIFISFSVMDDQPSAKDQRHRYGTGDLFLILKRTPFGGAYILELNGE